MQKFKQKKLILLTLGVIAPFTFTTTKVMMNLFEAGFLSGVNTTEFSFMAQHYFRMDFQDNKE